MVKELIRILRDIRAKGMKRKGLTPRGKRFVTGMVIALGISALLCLSFYFNLLSSLQLRTGDLLFLSEKISRGNPANDKIVIVGIDDKSLTEMGQFQSLPREDYADVVDILSQAGARVIVFDIMFSEPASGDTELAQSMAQAGNVIMPEATSDTTISDAASQSFLKPLPSLIAETTALGHANISLDADGTVRRLSAVLNDNGTQEPALSLAAVAKYLRRPSVLESGIENGGLSFYGRNIPIINGNQFLINYQYSSSDETSFSQVSFVDVLSNRADPSIFKDKIVLIGATATGLTGLGDEFWTPLGMMKGVKIQANAINMILNGIFLKPAPIIATTGLMLALGLICAYVALRWKLMKALITSSFLLVGFIVAAVTLFDRGIMLSVFYPSLTILGSVLGVNVYNVAVERKQRGELGKTFGRYVSPAVAEKILNSLEQGQLQLGGQEQAVTVMFADVRGYTALAQEIQPSKLISLLNTYLSVIIQSVIKNEGMVNKFAGDNIMAVWNAPTNCVEHPLMAVKTALAAQKAVADIWQQSLGLPRMEFGIGINTGLAVVGNMGSEDRLEYSVIGDTVNLAARITAAAPANRIWIGATTYEKVKDYVEAKQLENLTVKGSRLPVPVYEVAALVAGVGSLEDSQEGMPRRGIEIKRFDFKRGMAGIYTFLRLMDIKVQTF
jgi:adenylate cyclase